MSQFLNLLSEKAQHKIINMSEMQKVLEYLLQETMTVGEWRYYKLSKPFALWQGVKFGAALLFSKRTSREIYQLCNQRSLGMYVMSPVYQGDVLKKSDDYVDVAVFAYVIDQYFPKLMTSKKQIHQKIAHATITALEQVIDYAPLFQNADLIVPQYHEEAIKRLQNESR